jgi:fucose permease
MPEPSGAGQSVGKGYGEIFSRPVFYILAFELFLYVGVEVGTETWLVQYLIGKWGEDSRRLATNILSFGFAAGLLVGRVAVARLFANVAEWKVTLGFSIAMAVTTYGMLGFDSQTAVIAFVFCAGVACAPMFPTILAMTGNAFTQNAAQALGTVITIGWFGFLVIPPLIGKLGGSNLGKGLLLLPLCSLVIALLNLGLRPEKRAALAVS